MKETKDEIIRKLVKKYYFRITKDCLELSPKIEDSFKIRKQVISNLKELMNLE